MIDFKKYKNIPIRREIVNEIYKLRESEEFLLNKYQFVEKIIKIGIDTYKNK